MRGAALALLNSLDASQKAAISYSYHDGERIFLVLPAAEPAWTDAARYERGAAGIGLRADGHRSDRRLQPEGPADHRARDGVGSAGGGTGQRDVPPGPAVVRLDDLRRSRERRRTVGLAGGRSPRIAALQRVGRPRAVCLRRFSSAPIPPRCARGRSRACASWAPVRTSRWS